MNANYKEPVAKTATLKEREEMLTCAQVESFLKSGKDRGLSPRTLKWYRVFLEKYAAEYPELPEKPEPIESFIHSYHTSDERRHGCFRTLRALYNYIEFREENFKNPFKRILPPRRSKKEKPFMTLEQIRQLLECPSHSPEIRALLYLLADTGARIGEAANLKHEYILHNENTGESLVKLIGKTGERIVPLSSKVRDLLMVLPGPEPFPWSSATLSRYVKKAFTDAGLKGSAHIIRHSFVSLWEGNIDSLKTITGHTSVTMIENYRHNKISHASREHKMYSPISKLYQESPIEEKHSGAAADPQRLIEMALELGQLRERIHWADKPIIMADVMKVEKYISFISGVFQAAGLDEIEAESYAWDFWTRFIKDDVNQEDEMLIKAGVCPQCKTGGWLIPVDNPLIDYECMNCGEKLFMIGTH